MTNRTITSDQLAAWRALSDAASKEPWTADHHCVSTSEEYVNVRSRDDAAFIAASRTAVPVLLHEVERLRAALAEACTMVRVGHDPARLAELERIAGGEA